MNNYITPEQFEDAGISKIVVNYTMHETGVKSTLKKAFRLYSRKVFDIYKWCIFRDNIIKMEAKGICEITYK